MQRKADEPLDRRKRVEPPAASVAEFRRNPTPAVKEQAAAYLVCRGGELGSERAAPAIVCDAAYMTFLNADPAIMRFNDPSATWCDHVWEGFRKTVVLRTSATRRRRKDPCNLYFVWGQLETTEEGEPEYGWLKVKLTRDEDFPPPYPGKWHSQGKKSVSYDENRDSHARRPEESAVEVHARKERRDKIRLSVKAAAAKLAKRDQLVLGYMMHKHSDSKTPAPTQAELAQKISKRLGHPKPCTQENISHRAKRIGVKIVHELKQRGVER